MQGPQTRKGFGCKRLVGGPNRLQARRLLINRPLLPFVPRGAQRCSLVAGPRVQPTALHETRAAQHDGPGAVAAREVRREQRRWLRSLVWARRAGRQGASSAGGPQVWHIVVQPGTR